MYTEKDCEPCDGSQCLIDRVVVLRQEEKSGQIFLCLGGEGSGILAERGALRLICLENGERHIGWRENMLGILRPELLGEKERLHLKQICPGGRKPEGNGRYWGYCFLEDGRLSDGVALRSMEEAHRYVLMQKRYQYRIKICSLDGQVILEERQGKRVEPSGDLLE